MTASALVGSAAEKTRKIRPHPHGNTVELSSGVVASDDLAPVIPIGTLSQGELLLRSRLAFNREEAALVMGISTDTLDRIIRVGELKARKFGRCVIIGRTQIEDYLAGVSA